MRLAGTPTARTKPRRIAEPTKMMAMILYGIEIRFFIKDS
jgi:hypothetical protein